MDALALEINKLKQTVGVLQVNDLTDLSKSAIRNLKNMLDDPNSAFANDPALALDATKALSKINTDTIEAQRRVIDTLIRYNSQLEKPVVPADNLIPQGEEVEAPAIESPAVSTFD